MEGTNNEVKYAGFWVRFLAFVIDGLILSIPMMVTTRPKLNKDINNAS